MQRPPRDELLVFGAPRVEEDEIREVVDSLRSGWLGSGPKVARFETLFRDYAGAPHAVAVSSCSAALHLSLLAAGVGPGDEVVTSAMTFAATANAIVHCGATPVLVDCDRRTQLLDLDRLRDALGPRARAERGLAVVEDAAHAIEARFRRHKVGSASPFTCFSFYATKNVATGEGGMVTTLDAAHAETIRVLRNHGLSRDAWARSADDGPAIAEVVAPGFKYTLTDLAAALGLHQLARSPANLARREAIWRRYDEAFGELPVETPAPAEPDTVHARHLYTLLVDPARAGVSRDELARRLRRDGIGTGVHYVGVHVQPWYRERFGFRPADFPNATWIGERTLSLPLSAGLSDEDVEDVIAAVRRGLAG